MTLPFNQATRALQADREWPTLWITASVLVLLVCWLVWFLWAPVSLYETGSLAAVTRRGLVIAYFPTTLLGRVQPGQSALLRVEETEAAASLPTQPALAAVVLSVDTGSTADELAVTLATLSAQWPASTLSSGYPISGSVTVAVEEVSPAQLLWRSTGQGVDSSAVLLGSTAP
jgi:hypothetical protein